MKKYFTIAVLSFLAFGSLAHAQAYSFADDNLTIGSVGPDVTALQTWLIDNGYSIPSIASGVAAKGYFGQQTQAALIAYQEAAGLPATGFFGPLTRAKLNAVSSVSPAHPVAPISPPSYPSYPVSPSSSIAVLSPNGGEQWQIGTSQYISWNAPQYPQVATVDIKLIPYQQPCTTQICPMYILAPYTIANDVSMNQNSYLWIVGNTASSGIYNCPMIPAGVSVTGCGNGSSYSVAPAGQYSVQVCETGTSVCDTSNSTFTIYSSGSGSAGTTAGPLNIISPNGGQIWQEGTVQQITWTSPYYFAASTVSLNLLRQYSCTTQICPTIAYAPYTIATGINANQNSYSWNVGTATGYTGGLQVIPAGQYSIQICQTGGGSCDTSDSTFTIASAGNTPYYGTVPANQTYYSNPSCPIGYTCVPNQSY